MSRRQKRTRHRIPAVALELKSDPIDERYWAEVEASTSRLERQYRKATKALAAAEAKAERKRLHIERLVEQQREAARIAERRAAEEQRLLEYIQRIKIAAQESRINAARAEIERQRSDAIARQKAQAAARKTAARVVREREQLIIQQRREQDALLLTVENRRRELHEIERLMQAEGYGRDSKRRLARHESGAITIPLGATTGQHPKFDYGPTFPVEIRRKGA